MAKAAGGACDCGCDDVNGDGVATAVVVADDGDCGCDDVNGGGVATTVAVA